MANCPDSDPSHKNRGPSYFCSSATHAKACGADVKDCKKYCNKDYPDVLKGDLCLLQQ